MLRKEMRLRSEVPPPEVTLPEAEVPIPLALALRFLLTDIRIVIRYRSPQRSRDRLCISTCLLRQRKEAILTPTSRTSTVA